MVPISMTMSDPWALFEGRGIFWKFRSLPKTHMFTFTTKELSVLGVFMTMRFTNLLT